jgi:hypothetical protein
MESKMTNMTAQILRTVERAELEALMAQAVTAGDKGLARLRIQALDEGRELEAIYPPMERTARDLQERQPDETLTATAANDRLEIYLTQHEDGRWMWGMSAKINWGGRAFAPHPRWGLFAGTRDEALESALQEVEDRFGQDATPLTSQIRPNTQLELPL